MESTNLHSSPPLLSMNNLHKWFGGVHALCNARMILAKRGVVHALMGENGSGKSTMLNILSGQLRPDEGIISLEGLNVTFHSPPDALAHGISMVSQETALAEDLSVAENVLLGHRLIKGRFGIDWDRTRDHAREILSQIGADFDPASIVRLLRPDQKQMVEIARALSSKVRILILDEPTSSLTDEETKGLFAAIRRLKEQGVSIIYVSHRLPEVFEIADEMTILRDGITVAEGLKNDFSPQSLVQAMVGKEKPPSIERKRSGNAEMAPVLRIRNLCLKGCLTDVNIDIHKGEIVGLAGLLGSGRRELLEVIFGMRSQNSGTIFLSEQLLNNLNPRVAINNGIGLVPPDRKTQGIILPMAVRDNLAISATSEQWRLMNPRNKMIFNECSNISRLLSIKAALSAEARMLSGGNQQKVALGKWLIHPPKVLLLDEPTRGVDVSAKGEIHRHLKDAASRGIAMLVSSSEYDELCDLCDRIVVFFRGRVIATLQQQEATEAKLAALAGGTREGEKC